MVHLRAHLSKLGVVKCPNGLGAIAPLREMFFAQTTFARNILSKTTLDQKGLPGQIMAPSSNEDDKSHFFGQFSSFFPTALPANFVPTDGVG
jgi:hypothetical protein